jgi:alcohol dehydrogenase
VKAGAVTSAASARPRLVVGPGAVARLDGELERLGSSRPLLVCGRATAADEHLLSELEPVLTARSARIASLVRPDVPLASVAHVADELHRHGADALVAIGGGAAITTCRAANVLAHESLGLDSLSTHIDRGGRVTSPRLRGTRVPLVVVATTPTTAVPKAGAAVTQGGRRHALFDPRTRAASVIVDGTIAARVPGPSVLAAVLNAYVMALEGWMSRPRHPYAAVLLRGAVHDLTDVLRAPEGLATVTELERAIVAAIAVGEATDLTGGGMAAALSHTIGPLVAAPNGALDALLLPHVVDAADPARRSALDELSRSLPLHALDVLGSALRSQPWSDRLRDHGLDADRLDSIAQDALTDVSAWSDGHRDPGAQALAILRAAW